MKRVLFQHAYLVTDLEQSIDKWTRVFGAGPFQIVAHHRAPTFHYRGTDSQADVSYAFGYLGELMIQLVQQHDDQASIYRDMYKAGQEGFHHIAYLVHDFAAERQRLIDLGYEPACELFADGVNAAYFDARADFGGFIEIHGDPPHIIAVFERWKRAHLERVNAG
ncbi:MAG: methylmalonyl-CoA epimerase [Rhodospirillales bacterium]|nr:methylmalonyl-CoA epimerase [Rhodospirillales bacterium]